MKKLIMLFALVAMTSCAGLRNVSSEGLTYKNGSVYHNEIAIAKLSGVEIAYDNRKLVREVTFKLNSPEYNQYAYGIIKLITKQNPSWEVEVEIDPYSEILK
jgi:hypothetical protein